MGGGKGRQGGFEFKLGFRFYMRTAQYSCRDGALLFFLQRPIKNARLPTLCEILLPHLGFWSPPTTHTGLFAVASHSSGTRADGSPPTYSSVCEGRGETSWCLLQWGRGGKNNKAMLTGIILSTRTISLSFLGWICECDTFK